MEKLIYHSSPVITLASNHFVNVPTVFQYEDTPLIEVVQAEKLGYTSSISIFHQDGTYLAKVNGTRAFPTETGRLAGIVMEKLKDRWICRMEKKEIFEILHQPGDAFKILAELYTPDGRFVKLGEEPLPQLFDIAGNAIRVGGVTMTGNTFQNCRIGILLKKDGSCAIGVS